MHIRTSPAALTEILPPYLGVHAPDRPYIEPPVLDRWMVLHLCGMGAHAAPVAWKVYDEGWRWRDAMLPGSVESATAPHQVYLSECRRFSCRPVVSYCAFTKRRPGSDADVRGVRSALSASMRKFILSVPVGAGVMFGNEREKTWLGSPALWFELEAEFGAIAIELGRKWYVGGDLVEANTLETIEQRRAAWKPYGIEPHAIVFHSYGQDGTLPRHVKDIWEALKRVTGRAWRLAWLEWGWGFPGEGKTRADRPDLDAADTGAWCGEFALALAEIGAEGCAFTLDQHYDATGAQTDAAAHFAQTVLSGDATVPPRLPPATKAKERTRRYLSIGRNPFSAFFHSLVA